MCVCEWVSERASEEEREEEREGWRDGEGGMERERRSDGGRMNE